MIGGLFSFPFSLIHVRIAVEVDSYRLHMFYSEMTCWPLWASPQETYSSEEDQESGALCPFTRRPKGHMWWLGSSVCTRRRTYQFHHLQAPECGNQSLKEVYTHYRPVLQETQSEAGLAEKRVEWALHKAPWGWHRQPRLIDAGGASDRSRLFPEVKLLLDPNPDLTEPPAWPSPQTRCLPGGNGPSREDLWSGLVAKAVPGPMWPWERHCPLRTRSAGHVWLGSTLRLGSIQHAGQSLGLPGGWESGPLLGHAIQASPQALCVGKGVTQAPESGVWTREEEAHSKDAVLGCCTERGPGVTAPV